jgi:hypothetical protein
MVLKQCLSWCEPANVQARGAGDIRQPAPSRQTEVAIPRGLQRFVELSRYAAGAVEPLDPVANVQYERALVVATFFAQTISRNLRTTQSKCDKSNFRFLRGV